MMIAPTKGFVFPGVERGTNFPYSHYAYVARKTQVTLGRDPISLHVLRHSFASRAAARLQPDQVRDLLGHASFDTSLEWYIKSPDGWQDAARELLSVRT
jgi:integrase